MQYNAVYCLWMLEFQFLIGKVKLFTNHWIACWARGGFQFLIGKVKLSKHFVSKIPKNSTYEFQFLIGKVKLEDDDGNKYVAIWFQFLIGKVKQNMT